MFAYTQADPIGLAGSLASFSQSDPLPMTLSLYAYASNAPVRFTDPTGLITCKCRRRLKPDTKRRSWHPDHVYIRVGGASRCEQNPSFGFFGEISPIASFPGTVIQNDSDTTDETCGVVPCQDDTKVLDFLLGRKANPGPYICVGRNCADFANSAVKAGQIPNCCPAIDPSRTDRSFPHLEK